MSQTIFHDFLHKFKYITRTSSETDVAKELGIKPRSFNDMKRNDKVPFEEVIKYCEQRQIDILWITNLQNNS